MVNKCCVTGCKGNYSGSEKVSVFRFPEDVDLRRKWIGKIARKDFSPTPYSRVCIKHFDPKDILWETSAHDVRSGKSVTAKLSSPRIREGAIPSLFPSCPSYISSSSLIHENPKKRRKRIEMEKINKCMPDSLVEKGYYKNSRSFKNLQELKVEPVRSSSRNQPWLPKLQPRPAGISQDQSSEQPSSDSNLSPQPSRLSSHYPSHPPALSGPFTLPNQSNFDDSHLSMFLSETRMQTAELRMAMGQLTDKVDGILSKLDQFSQYQSRQQRQKLRAKHAEFEVEEDDRGRNEDKETTISKSKLTARIIAMEEKLEIMEKENITLKKDLEDTTSKLVSLQDNQPIEISKAINSALNAVYSDLETKFSNSVDYEGLTIRKTIAATVIAVTHQFLDSNIGEKTDSDSSRKRKMEEVPSVQIKTSKQKLKGIPGDDLKKLSQKGYSSEIDVVASSSTTCHVDEEMNAENPDIAHRESLEHTHRKPFDLLESTATLQYDDELIVKEENCSDASSREGSMEMVINMEPLSPPIFDAGEMSESGEEWLPD